MAHNDFRETRSGRVATEQGESPNGLRVLVVDDSPDIRALIELVIRRRGVGWQLVGTADSGERAVELARITQPNVVLLDISMPGMGGLEALPLVHEVAPEAVVIMLTGFISAEVRASAEAAGAQGYLVKDSLVRTLVPRVEAVLADLHGGAVVPEAASVPNQRRDSAAPVPPDRSRDRDAPVPPVG